MRRLLLLLTLTIAMALPAIADEVTFTYAGHGYSNAQDFTGKSTDVLDANNNVIAVIAYSNGTNNQNKPGFYTSDNTLRLYNGNTLTVTAGKDDVTLESVKFDDSEKNFTSASTVDKGNWNASTATWTPKNEDNGFTLTAKSSVKILSVTITYSIGAPKEPNGLTYGADADVTVYLNATEIGLPTLSNPYDLAVTYTSTKPEVATVDNAGKVEIKAAGTTTITATTAGNETYAAGTAEYDLTVMDASVSAPAGYRLLTNLVDLTNGTKGIIVSTKDGSMYAMGAQGKNNRTAVKISLTDGLIPIENNGSVIVFGKNAENKYSLKDGNEFMVAGSSTNTSTSSTERFMPITLNSENNAATIQLYNTSNRSLRMASTCADFRNYASGNGEDVQIYIEQAGQEPQYPAATTATVDDNTKANMENGVLYVLKGEKATISLAEPTATETFLYYRIDGGAPVRYTEPFTVEAGQTVEYYTEWHGLKTTTTLPVEAVDFGKAHFNTTIENGAFTVTFDEVEGMQIWYRFESVAQEAPARVTTDAQGFTLYEAPFTLDRAGNLQFKAESHGLTSETYNYAISENDLSTGVENVAVADGAEAEYYDLNGRRVLNPAAGIYIRIAGGKATKAIIR